MTTDPFAAPAAVPSTFANIQSFHGRLCLWKPTGTEMVPNDKGQMKPRLTVDVTVVDGQGPVQKFARFVPTGVFLDGPDFPGTYVNGQRLVMQLDAALKSGGTVLARLGLYKEGQPQGQGNPWGLVDPTDADKQMARDFLAGRTVAASAAPAAAPSPGQPVPASAIAHTYSQAQPAPGQPQQYAAPAPAYAQPQPAPAPTAPQPTGYVPGANPFVTG